MRQGDLLDHYSDPWGEVRDVTGSVAVVGRFGPHRWDYRTSRLGGNPVRECAECGTLEVYWDADDGDGYCPAGAGYFYRFELSDRERDALAWIADRYPSAGVLYDGAEWTADNDGDRWVALVSEHVARNYRDALADDNGDPDAVLPPCAGGRLADVLLDLWNAIDYRDEVA